MGCGCRRRQRAGVVVTVPGARVRESSKRVRPRELVVGKEGQGGGRPAARVARETVE